METMRFARPPEPVCKSIRSVWLVRQMQQSAADGSGKITGAIRPSAVAGLFYPVDRTALKQLINQQLDYGQSFCNSWSLHFQRGAEGR